ncbi:hypothetical protein [uncultured Tolumonas sp.]|uniref:hypothetical protein n=1 Tax=uncultured Tolumonas sp. TaxID=263765 RepID=UPI002930688F|nr:hypothetical protein [uncultured Tolumonas sp.]
MINWISLDNVTYHWDGDDCISCETNNGFSSVLSGSSLDGLEILDSDGVLAGELFVDFAGAALSYIMLENTQIDQVVTYCIKDNVYSSPVSELAQSTDFSDLVAFDSEQPNLWSDIAYESQANIHNDENSVLDIDSLLFLPEKSLDKLLMHPEASDIKLPVSNSHDLSCEPAMGHYDNLIDPLDMLLVHNANYTNN